MGWDTGGIYLNGCCPIKVKTVNDSMSKLYLNWYTTKVYELRERVIRSCYVARECNITDKGKYKNKTGLQEGK